jgi:hypothetical protein
LSFNCVSCLFSQQGGEKEGKKGGKKGGKGGKKNNEEAVIMLKDYCMWVEMQMEVGVS